MEKKEDLNYFFSFSFEDYILNYAISEDKDEVWISGEEIFQEKTIFQTSISFSSDEKERCFDFCRILVESRTFPRMMEELAEEFFF